MSNSMSKADAIDLLGDLMGIAPTDNTNLFGEERPKAPRKSAPKWQLSGLVLLYKSTTCNNCGTVHTEINPLVMAHEELVAHDGSIVKSQTTSDPALIHTKDFQLADLPTRTEYVQMRPISFCVECVESLAQKDLRSLFVTQKREAIVEAAVQTSTQLSDLNAKREQAEKTLLDLAASWENPMNAGLDPESF